MDETVGLNRGAAARGKNALARGLLVNPRDRPTLASQGIDKNLAQQATCSGHWTTWPSRTRSRKRRRPHPASFDAPCVRPRSSRSGKSAAPAPHSAAANSPATSVTCVRLQRSAVVGRIILWRENYHRAISDFCNTIGTNRTCRNGGNDAVALREYGRSRRARRRESGGGGGGFARTRQSARRYRLICDIAAGLLSADAR